MNPTKTTLPMKIKIPKGWRRLPLNAVIREGDKFFNQIESMGPLGWTPSLSIGFRVQRNHLGCPYIRLKRRKGPGARK